MKTKKELKNSIKVLQEQIQPLRDELYDIEQKEKDIEMRKDIGKCYLYKNSYSGDDKWDLFAKILDVKDGNYIVVICEKTCYGDIEIKTSSQSWNYYTIEITKARFDKAYNQMIKEIKDLQK